MNDNRPKRRKLQPGDPDYRPARQYKWPDAEPGNLLALRHGARSPRVYVPIARELVAAVVAERPDLAPYAQAVEAWAEAEARAGLLREWLAHHGEFDADDQPREGALKWLVQFEKRAEAGRKRLGLDPVAHAELARHRVEAERTAVDLDGLRAAGRAILDAAEVVDDEPGEVADRDDDRGDDHEEFTA